MPAAARPRPIEITLLSASVDAHLTSTTTSARGHHQEKPRVGFAWSERTHGRYSSLQVQRRIAAGLPVTNEIVRGGARVLHQHRLAERLPACLENSVSTPGFNEL